MSRGLSGAKKAVNLIDTPPVVGFWPRFTSDRARLTQMQPKRGAIPKRQLCVVFLSRFSHHGLASPHCNDE